MKIKLYIFITLIIPVITVASNFQDVPQNRPGIYGSSKNVSCPIKILPGIGLGPFEIGHDLKEVENLGMEIKTVQGSKSSLVIGRYSIGLDYQNKIMVIEAEIGDLPNCLIFDKRKVSNSTTKKKLAKIFKNCKKEENREGGNLIECKGISIGTGGWGGQQKTPTLKITAQP